MKIGIFIKKELEEEDIATSIISKINEYGFEFDLDNPDVVIFVGGDGTFLRAAHEYMSRINDVIFVGINKGTLGYFTNYTLDDLDEILITLHDEEYIVKSYSLLEARFNNQLIYSINEFRIENPFHTLIADVYIDQDRLETFRGNGLCVSSTLGSSAYNKSLGGCIVVGDIEILQLVGIAPINNRIYQSISSPIIVGENSSITFDGNFNECVIGYDHLTTKIESDHVTISLSDKKVNIMMRSGNSVVKKVKEALSR